MAQCKVASPNTSTNHWIRILTMCVCIQTTSSFVKQVTCSAGHFLDKDPETLEEICRVCESKTYRSEDNHRKTFCEHCDEDFAEGAWVQVNRPCTSKSNIEIGCLTNVAYRIPNSGKFPGFKCKQCTSCGKGEVETAYCTEHTDRVCQPKIEKTKQCDDGTGNYTNPASQTTSQPLSPPTTTSTTTSTPQSVTKPVGKKPGYPEASLSQGQEKNETRCQCEASNTNIIILLFLLLVISLFHFLYSIWEHIKTTLKYFLECFKRLFSRRDEGNGLPAYAVPYKDDSETDD